MRGCDIILQYFIAGMVFVSIISPLLEEIATVIVQGLQILNGFFKLIVTKQSLEISRIKLEMENLIDEDDKKKTPKVGFVVDSEEEEE